MSDGLDPAKPIKATWTGLQGQQYAAQQPPELVPWSTIKVRFWPYFRSAAFVGSIWASAFSLLRMLDIVSNLSALTPGKFPLVLAFFVFGFVVSFVVFSLSFAMCCATAPSGTLKPSLKILWQFAKTNKWIMLFLLAAWLLVKVATSYAMREPLELNVTKTILMLEFTLIFGLFWFSKLPKAEQT